MEDLRFKNQCLISTKSNNKAHEHNIKMIKGSKAAIGIFDDVISLAKWGLTSFSINLGEKNIYINMTKTASIVKKKCLRKTFKIIKKTSKIRFNIDSI